MQATMAREQNFRIPIGSTVFVICQGDNTSAMLSDILRANSSFDSGDSIVGEAIRDDFEEIISKSDLPDSFKKLTRQQAADYLHVSLQTLWLLVRKHKIPYQKFGRRVLFNLTDLHDFSSAGFMKG